jgi:hypothetical protein
MRAFAKKNDDGQNTESEAEEQTKPARKRAPRKTAAKTAAATEETEVPDVKQRRKRRTKFEI